MASAAVVATNASQSPQPFLEHDETLDTTGTIASADATLPDEVAGADDDDDEDDVARPTRRKPAATMDDALFGDDDEAPGNGDANHAEDLNSDDDAELFGSEPDDEGSSPCVLKIPRSLVRVLTNMLENLDYWTMKSSIQATTKGE